MSEYHVTLSTPDDIKDIPPTIREFLESGVVARAYAVAEKASKWHIHMAIALSNKSRIDNFKRTFVRLLDGDERFKSKHSICIKSIKTCTIEGIAGGYLGKDEKTIVLYNKGFSKTDLKTGKAEHEKGQSRARIIDFLDHTIIVSREKYDAFIGAVGTELETTDEGECVKWAVANRFAFSTSIPESRRGEVLGMWASSYKGYHARRMQERNDISPPNGGSPTPSPPGGKSARSAR